MHRVIVILTLLTLLAVVATPARAVDRRFTTSDGVQLHFIDQGQGPTIVMVPGWTMPAWIFSEQISDFSHSYRVVALDPRGQGDSDVPPTGYDPYRRGRDIADLLAHVDNRPVVLLGWSLGVLDALSYIHQFGDAHVAGLVLVDNSVGEGPAPHATAPARRPRHPRKQPAHNFTMRGFVRSMFVEPQPADYIDRLTEATLRTPPAAARALLHYDVPREFWKEAIYATSKPVLYLVRPRLQVQAYDLARHRPDTQTYVLRDVGHAMFVDDPGEFDRLVSEFLRQRVWK
jgi:microsomal epoxide hydrolase